jgi:hypothetical protein
MWEVEVTSFDFLARRKFLKSYGGPARFAATPRLQGSGGGSVNLRFHLFVMDLGGTQLDHFVRCSNFEQSLPKMMTSEKS